MRRHRISVAVATLMTLLVGLAPAASAGGNTAPPGCLVESPTGGPEMSGSAAFKANGLNTGTNIAASVDVTLSLKFRNQQTETDHFVTGTIPDFSFVQSPEGVACTMLQALRPAILAELGLVDKQLKICFSRNPNDKRNCQSISRFDFDSGGTNLGLAIINRIFVVD